jgi:pimeloyl-ACP methyl ester carboxylesterase
MGRSDYQDRRSLLHWPTDVVALTDALGIGRFSVLGWSCGGPYAAVCGAKMPERVAAGALLSSSVPFEAYGTRRGLTSDDRFLLVLCRWAPQLASAVLHVSVRRASPERLRAVVSRDMTEADMASLDAVGPPEVSMAFLAESVRHGPRGGVRDYRVFGAPWGFALEEIDVPMHIWEGEDDRTGPPGYRQLLHERIAQSTLTVVPGEGHISLLRNRALDILAPLVDALR